MAKLDPTKPPPKTESEIVPASMYPLGITWFRRKVGKDSKQDYHSVKFVILDGPMKGKGFFSILSLDLSKTGTVRRWQILCECLKIEEEFELGSTQEGNDNEGDANFKRLFVGRGFMGKVGVQSGGGYRNNTVEEIKFRKNWTAKEEQIIADWEAEWKAKADDFGAPDDEGPLGGNYDEFDNRNDSSADDDSLDF